MPDWLDLELSHQLRPTEAPSELWTRIDRTLNRPARQKAPARSHLPIAAILTLALGAGTLWLIAKAEPPARHFATAAPNASSCLLCHTSL
jgi:hypothetical protein